MTFSDTEKTRLEKSRVRLKAPYWGSKLVRGSILRARSDFVGSSLSPHDTASNLSSFHSPPSAKIWLLWVEAGRDSESSAVEVLSAKSALYQEVPSMQSFRYPRASQSVPVSNIRLQEPNLRQFVIFRT